MAKVLLSTGVIITGSPKISNDRKIQIQIICNITSRFSCTYSTARNTQESWNINILVLSQYLPTQFSIITRSVKQFQKLLFSIHNHQSKFRTPRRDENEVKCFQFQSNPSLNHQKNWELHTNYRKYSSVNKSTNDVENISEFANNNCDRFFNKRVQAVLSLRRERVSHIIYVCAVFLNFEFKTIYFFNYMYLMNKNGYSAW